MGVAGGGGESCDVFVSVLYVLYTLHFILAYKSSIDSKRVGRGGVVVRAATYLCQFCTFSLTHCNHSPPAPPPPRKKSLLNRSKLFLV